MAAVIYDVKVVKIEHWTRGGEQYIVINETSWYPARSWTEEAASADYVFTHSNHGFNFVPRFAKTV